MNGLVSIHSRRVGHVEVELDKVLIFSGIPGFPNARRFAVVDHDSHSAFAWLVSLDDPDLAFVIANPWDFFPGYDPAIQVEHLSNIAIEGPDELDIVAIVSFVDRGEVLLNLAAPLLINGRARRGAQVILDDPRYTTRDAIPELVEPRDEARGEVRETAQTIQASNAE